MDIKECMEQAFGPGIQDQIEDWDNLEAALGDITLGPILQENIIGFRAIIRGTRNSINDYVCACRFATMITSGVSDHNAFEAIFPDRYAKLKAAGNQNLSQGVYAYKRTMLVRRLLEQIKLPLHIVMQDYRIDALTTLHTLMLDDEVHPRDRVSAASALATHLAPPKESIQKVEITDNRVDGAIAALAQHINQMSQKQIIDIQEGTTTTNAVGRSKLLNHEQ